MSTGLRRLDDIFFSDIDVNFEQNSQPLYVILDPEGNVLVEPYYYMKKNKNDFLKKLDRGLFSIFK